ncbi:MAG: MarR family transcriptional regulator [Desulfotalea sp.]|nr:MAG: MarR family transcriptional regulator [Desulfotalea sp.]
MDKVDLLLKQWATERPDLDSSPMGVIGRLTILNRSVEKGFQQSLENVHITMQEFDVLAVLRRCGPPFQQAVGVLCSYTLLSSGAMTNRIDRLVKKELVLRKPNPEDRRGVIVALSEQGRTLIDELLPVRFEEAYKIVSVLSSAERNDLEKLLKKMTDAHSEECAAIVDINLNNS